jgi:hypothetical protein
MASFHARGRRRAAVLHPADGRTLHCAMAELGDPFVESEHFGDFVGKG